MELKYVGPHGSGVSVPLPGGGEVHVPKNGKGDLPSEVAKSLLEQGRDHWVRWATDGRSQAAKQRDEEKDA